MYASAWRSCGWLRLFASREALGLVVFEVCWFSKGNLLSFLLDLDSEKGKRVLLEEGEVLLVLGPGIFTLSERSI